MSESFEERTMRQAGMTAEVWMIDAARFVRENFDTFDKKSRAILISAFVLAAALDELAIFIHNQSPTQE